MPDPRFVIAAKTPVTVQQAYQALQNAWVDAFGAPPKPDSPPARSPDARRSRPHCA